MSLIQRGIDIGCEIILPDKIYKVMKEVETLKFPIQSHKYQCTYQHYEIQHGVMGLKKIGFNFELKGSQWSDMSGSNGSIEEELYNGLKFPQRHTVDVKLMNVGDFIIANDGIQVEHFCEATNILHGSDSNFPHGSALERGWGVNEEYDYMSLENLRGDTPVIFTIRFIIELYDREKRYLTIQRFFNGYSVT